MFLLWGLFFSYGILYLDRWDTQKVFYIFSRQCFFETIIRYIVMEFKETASQVDAKMKPSYLQKYPAH